MVLLTRQIKSQKGEIHKLNGLLHRALKQEVWYWQGDGYDFPDSISCPVIMSAETLRDLMYQRDAAPWARKIGEKK
jgi:hypothetical protein